jgi:hypothetical protein
VAPNSLSKQKGMESHIAEMFQQATLQVALMQFLIWGCIQKSQDWVDNEIYAYNNKHSLRSNVKGYGGKTH